MQKTGLIISSLFFLGLVFSLSAQDKQTLLWAHREVVHPASGEAINVPSFNDAIINQDLLPKKAVRIDANVTSFTLSNIQFSPLGEESANIWKKDDITNSFEVEITKGSERGRAVSFIYITAIRKSALTGALEKLNSYTYKYTTGDQALSAASLINTSGSNLKISSSSSSVLSSGTWHKLCISGSGIFKIDQAYLKSIGLDPSSVDPRQIRIFGNGGGMLPQSLSQPRHDDLIENHIYVAGEQDGKFDAEDYVLIFGQGPDTWKYNTSTKRYSHTKNIYSDAACYFLTIGPSNGLRIQDKTSASGAAQTITSFEDHVFLEDENENILHSGREWFGDKFNYTLQRAYNFSFPGLVPSSELVINTSVMGASNVNTRFYLTANDVKADTIVINGISNIFSYSYGFKGHVVSSVTKINSNSWNNSESINISLLYDQGGVSLSSGYLNYFEITARRKLSLYGSQTLFRNSSSLSAAVSEYSISNFNSDGKIWDITDPLHPKNISYVLNNGEGTFTDSSSTLREYIAFSGTGFPAPVYAGTVPNQDLHAIGTATIPDLIIVTAPGLLAEANRLADHRRSFSGYDVEVVTTEQIYNEFSSGVQDISAIRDMAKTIYDRSTPSDPFSYLLLFGDCSYDYKNKVGNNTNLVPVYESYNSLLATATYSSDDYYGFLDDNEGAWEESQSGNHLMDIGVGRLPVRNLTEANVVVSKIINYDKNLSSMGKWRNRITFVADDGDSNIHQIHADSLAKKVNKLHPAYNVNKIYLDAFPQVPSPGGEIAAEANDQLTKQVEKGTLIVNYTGHGGGTGWTQEKVLELKDLTTWANYEKLAFMITATCEFGRYDEPASHSGAEVALLSEKGAAVGLMTTTRPVFSNSNFTINNSVYNYMFTPINGKLPTIGQVMYKTKNNSLEGVNNRNYSLLGDPSQTLAYPKEEVVLTKLNGKDISVTTDTLKALSKVEFEGEVRSGGMIMNGFNGTVNVTVYDKESVIETLGNDPGSGTMFFKLLNNFIYDGLATVTNGKFKLSFVIPKDINYNLGTGKISMYAKKDNELSDGHGYNSDIVIGGSAENVEEDNAPPKINLYMNDETFVFGGLTGENSTLLVKLFDENGINISGSGIGHEITAYLDNSNEPIILNEFYTASVEGYTQGMVEYPFKNLSPGIHSITVKAWDTHNNSSEATLEFMVANQENLELMNVLNYPNPFSTRTNFQFDHNRAGDDIEVLIQIYSISGKLVKTIHADFYMCKSHIPETEGELTWDGRDDFGDRIGNGVYVYKVEVRSLRDGSKSQKYQKLVILD